MSGVRVVFTKWGDRPHWEYDAVRLGSDNHGTWLGVPAGTRLARPGADFVSEQRFVLLVPPAAPFVASFYAPAAPPALDTGVDVYVDITTPPAWDESCVHLVDLDLDVVRGRSGRVWVDDEDEFATHRIRYDYPAHLVRTALASCEQTRRAVESAAPPYDGRTSARWISTLEATMMRR